MAIAPKNITHCRPKGSNCNIFYSNERILLLCLYTHKCLKFLSIDIKQCVLVLRWLLVNSNTKRQNQSDAAEANDEAQENELPDYERVAPPANSAGKYRCRYCGMLFDTLEEHDDHYHRVHLQAQGYLQTGNQS